MATRLITDEQLDSLASEYMTRDTISVIVNSVRASSEITSETPLTIKFAQVKILKDLYQWIQFTDCPECDNTTEWNPSYQKVNDRIETMQKRLIPSLQVIDFDYMSRTPSEAEVQETIFFEALKKEMSAWHDL